MGNFFYYILFTLAFISCSQTEKKETSREKWKHLEKRTLDSNVLKALERWHTDSLGCLNLRTAEDGDMLINAFGLENALADSVVSVLGKPDRSYPSEYSDLQGGFVKGTKYSYYFHSHCQGDSLSPESFISLIIADKTGRVFRRAGGVH